MNKSNLIRIDFKNRKIQSASEPQPREALVAALTKPDDEFMTDLADLFGKEMFRFKPSNKKNRRSRG